MTIQLDVNCTDMIDLSRPGLRATYIAVSYLYKL